MRNNYTPPPVMLFLLDASSKILWASEVGEPETTKSVVGKVAWYALSPPHDDVVRSAILLAIATGKPQMIDVVDGDDGIWRVWYRPVKVGKVRMVATCMAAPANAAKLTPREAEICAALATGAGGKQIAAKLGIRQTTLDNHKRNIASKLQIPTAALTAWAATNREWL
jgi:DNA-binding NarL/FixJ family response regulator